MITPSWLPEGGTNLFQEIKKKCAEAEAAGQKLWKLSIGQPTGAAMFEARLMASLATMIGAEPLSEYQDNGSPGTSFFYKLLERYPMNTFFSALKKTLPGEYLNLHQRNPLQEAMFVLGNAGRILQGLVLSEKPDPEMVRRNEMGFAREFSQFHVRTDLSQVDGLAYLPIPGIKSMLGLIPMACGGINFGTVEMGTMTRPGYPTPETWAVYLLQQVSALPTNPENAFRFSPDDIINGGRFSAGLKLLMLNGPHNPTGQIFTREWLEEICEFCQKNGIRIFNDAAYAAMAYGSDHCTLADVAIKFPGLSWAEAYSASKMGCNFTGWRVGAIIGSRDFVDDIATIKGNTDSGFFAPAAVGVLAAIRYNPRAILANAKMFQERQKYVVEILKEHGLQIACEPKGTFFNLWRLPKRAFGEAIRDARHFNFLMIERTGLVGVHFHPYIRYAVVADVMEEAFTEALHQGFDMARVEY